MLLAPTGRVIKGPLDAPLTGGGSGELTNGWTAITTEWSSLYDPNTYLSAFSNTDGVLSYTAAGDTTIYEGYGEGGPGVEVQVQALSGLESFDPATTKLYIYDDLSTFPTGVNDLYGMNITLLDDTLTNSAGADGIGFGLERSGAGSNTRALSQEVSTIGAGGTNNLGAVDAAFYEFSFKPTGTGIVTVLCKSWYRQDGTSTWDYGVLTNGGSMSDTGSDFYLAARMYHRSATSGTPTFVRKMYYRAFNTGADPA